MTYLFPELQPLHPWFYPIIINLTILHSSYKKNHLMVALLPLAYFFKQNVLKVHQYYSIYQSFITFYGWAKFYCVNFTFCFSSNLLIIIFSYLWFIMKAIVLNSDVLIFKFLLSVPVDIYSCVKLLDHVLIFIFNIEGQLYFHRIPNMLHAHWQCSIFQFPIMSPIFVTFHF